MSLLLDALNKADQERKRGDGPPSIDSRHDEYQAHTRQKIPTLIIVLGIGVILVILLGAVYWLGMQTHQTTTTIVTPSANTQQVPVTQQAESSETNHNQQNIPTENLAAQNTTNVEKASDDEGIATLYQQQSPATSTAVNATEPTVNAEHSPASPTSINQFANIPDLQDLPTNVLAKIPSLKYTEHNFNQNGGSVVINGAIKHVNDQLADGLIIDKILEDGMVLHFENYSFKMHALNTWINM